LSREAFAQRVSRQPGAGYVARPAGSAFATEAADAMQAASNPPNAAALAEVADAHRVHGMPGAAGHRQEFADCTNGHCASVTRAMRYIYANSTIGLRFAIISHAMNDHGLSFWACEVEPCCSADAGNREQYAGTVRIDQDEARVEMRVGPAVEFHGGPGMAVHIAADGSTVHQGKAAECTASGCMQARAGRDDSMADMEAAAIEQAWTAHAGHHRQGERPYVGLDSFEACIIAPCRDIDVMARVAYAGEHYVAAAANDLEAAWNIHGEHKPTDGPSSFESCDLMPCYGLSVADRETFASERGEPNDPHREG
jgi:hypothetical protein